MLRTQMTLSFPLTISCLLKMKRACYHTDNIHNITGAVWKLTVQATDDWVLGGSWCDNDFDMRVLCCELDKILLDVFTTSSARVEEIRISEMTISVDQAPLDATPACLWLPKYPGSQRSPVCHWIYSLSDQARLFCQKKGFRALV
jgi:hypothetical protein